MKPLFILFHVFLLFSQAYSQSTKEIIKKTLEVHLGKNDSWKSIKSIQKKGIIIDSNINDTTFFTDIKTANHKSWLESKIKQRTTIIGCNGSRLWYDISPKESRTQLHRMKKNVEDMEKGVYPHDANISLLYDIYEKNKDIKQESNQKIKNEECFVLRLDRGNLTTYFYISTQSYQIVAVKLLKDNFMLLMSHYEEYKKINGILFDIKTLTEYNGGKMYTTVQNIQINPTISEDIFESPQK
jgi:galactokinase/mevalonate kinase-like predicted kinase